MKYRDIVEFWKRKCKVHTIEGLGGRDILPLMIEHQTERKMETEVDTGTM